MKKLKYLLFILPFLFINTTYALDYTHTNKFAGIDASQKTGNFIDANSDVIGQSYYSVPKNLAYNYLVLTYCSSSDRVQPGFAPNIYVTDSIAHVDTREYCHTNYGSVTGTVKMNFFTIKNWYYNEDQAYLDVSYTYFHNSDPQHSQAFQFLGLSSQSSQDVSIAILAYLKSQQTNQDYSAILNDIKSNQNDYKQELKNVQSSIENTNSKLDNLDSTLKNDDVNDSTNKANEFFSGFTTDTFGLTSIITAPLELIASITSSTCSPLGLKVPFVENKTLNLPCMSSIYSQHFGSFLTIYQTITFGIIAYWVCVRIFALVKDFKNPDTDKVEVLDL